MQSVWLWVIVCCAVGLVISQQMLLISGGVSRSEMLTTMLTTTKSCGSVSWFLLHILSQCRLSETVEINISIHYDLFYMICKYNNIIIYNRRHPHIHEVFSIKNQTVELCQTDRQCLYWLRKRSYFNIDKTMMIMFYRAFIESILSFSLMAWFGNLTLKSRNSLSQIVKWSSRLIGEPQLNLETLYLRQLKRLSSSILDHDSHPLHSEFKLLPSGRRLLVPRSRTKRYKNSFIPAAIAQINTSGASHRCLFLFIYTIVNFECPCLY